MNIEIKPECIINVGDDLPFALYYPPSDGKLFWMCGEDPDGKIVSVFKDTDNNRKECRYLLNKKEALEFRRVLRDEGWENVKAPEIVFKDHEGKKFSSKDV